MAEKTDFPDEEKSLLWAQIRYKEEELESYELAIKDLKKQNEDLVSQYSALEKTTKEKIKQLQEQIGSQEKRADDLSEQVEDLSEQLEERKQKAKQKRETLQLQKQQQRKQELLELIEKHHKKHSELAAALVEKEKQRMILEQQVSDMEAMEKQLVNLPQEQEAEIHSLKMKMESDMKKLDETLQRELMDLSEVIAEKNRETSRKHMNRIKLLKNTKSQMVKELGSLRKMCDDLELSKQDLTKKTAVLIKQKTSLDNEVKQLEQTFRQLTQEKAEFLSNMSGAQNETETLRRRLARLPLKHGQVARRERLEAELKKEAARIRQLEKVKQEAADFIKHGLLDPDEPSEAQGNTQRLVEILKSGICSSQGKKPHL